jgi:hypothetical protein
MIGEREGEAIATATAGTAGEDVLEHEAVVSRVSDGERQRYPESY